MTLSRREFLITSAVAAAAGTAAVVGQKTAALGAAATQPAGPTTAPAGAFDAGPIDQYATDGVYDAFRQKGFILVRQDKQLFALSAYCTHKRCVVQSKPDNSIACKCHGSAFDAQGKVTHGPAKQPLPRLAVRLDERKHVLVDLSGKPA